MSVAAPIPRFLLPKRGAIWRANLPVTTSSILSIRHASNKKASSNGKPLVLEKPTKFNPPSHPQRLRREAPRYPGPNLSAEDAARQKTKKYPNMMPPPGSFMHWFLHNRGIHVYICLTTLFSLALFVFVTDFKTKSPFGHMVPAWADMFFHPIAFVKTWTEIIKLNSARLTAETQERRSRKVEDVAKRSAYRKAHGMDKDEGFGGWMAKSDSEALGPAIPIGDPTYEKTEQMTEPVEPQVVRQQRPPVKKWFGIWE